MTYGELSVAEWEERMEKHRERIAKEKKAQEIQQITASGMKRKRYFDSLKTQKLNRWC